MTNLNDIDLQNVSGGVTRMTQNNPQGSGDAGSYKPEDDQAGSDAK